MLVSYEWLKEYVDLEGISPEDIAEELNRTGIEVEVIYTRDAGVNGVVIGQVLSVEPHPNAERLKVCTVHVGQGNPLQIVCGAPNVAPMQRVPVALIGATLPGEVQIKKTKIRGIESFGMICSAQELGLPDKVLMKNQADGILVLDRNAPIGENIKEYLGMNDQIIELELTPNRSDCLSMIGVAYEVAAIFDRPLRLPEVEIDEAFHQEAPVNLIIEAEEECPFYAAQVIRNLKIGSSPQWLQNRLISAGIRPINNIVDITNYVMIETGQPLHAYDYHQVHGGEVIIRRARPGEAVVTLDGVTRACDDDTLLITDRKQVLGLAGVMGGQSTEVTNQTTTILLESAFFDPAIIRRTSRRLGLRSEASNRFEKGVDPERIIPALSRAVQLLQEIAGGEVASEIHVEEVGDIEDVVINLRHDRLCNLLGIQIDSEKVIEILNRLRFEVHYEDGIYEVQIPSRRPDITIEEDLIEEVARLYGYDQIPTTLPWGQQLPGSLTREQKFRRIIRHTLRNLGMHENVTYSLISSQAEKELASLDPTVEPIRIAMPMSRDHAVLRTSLLPSLIQTAKYNRNHGFDSFSLFEIGLTYLTNEKKLSKLPKENWHLAGLITGKQNADFWSQNSKPVLNFYHGKGILEALFRRLGIAQVEYREASLTGFHPGRTAEIVYDHQVIGVLGQLHPKLAKRDQLEETVLFEINLPKLFQIVNDQITYQPVARYPAVTRDLAIVVDEKVQVGKVEQGIRQSAGELLESITLFDVFQGEQLGDQKKSLAFSLVYRANDRTLRDDEVQVVHEKVIQYLEKTFHAKLRQ